MSHADESDPARRPLPPAAAEVAAARYFSVRPADAPAPADVSTDTGRSGRVTIRWDGAAAIVVELDGTPRLAIPSNWCT
jgi:hypothetical protein